MNDWIEPLVLAGTVSVATQTMVLFLLALIHRQTKGIQYWVISMLSYTALMCLYLYRSGNWFLKDASLVSIFLGVWLANFLLVLAWLTYARGIQYFLGSERFSRADLSVAALGILLLTYNTFVIPSLAWRSTWVSGIIAYYSLAMAYSLFSRAERQIRLTANVVAIVFIVVGSLSLIRFGVTIADNLNGHSPDFFRFGKEIFLGVPIFSSLWVFSLLLMIHQRQQALNNALYKRELKNERELQRDRQRLRLARDLHDGLSGMITSMRWISENQLTLPSDANSMRGALEKIQWLARESNEEVRMLLNKLENPNIEAQAWIADWRQYATSVSDLHGIQLEWSASGFGTDGLGDSLAAVCLWRVMKEALQNSCLHSGAEHLYLKHSIEDGWLNIQVGDDGKGYHGQSHEGRGMRNIRARISDLGGEVDFTNEPGLHIRMRVPLPLMLKNPISGTEPQSENFASLEFRANARL